MEQKNILKQALELIKNQRRHRQWLWGMTGLAALVVFMTVYLLILPAITMEHSGLEITAESLEAFVGRGYLYKNFCPCRKR